MIRYTLNTLVLLLSFVLSSAAYSASVDGVRVWRAPDHTRLVFDLSGPVEHKLFSLSNPQRLVIDITNAKMKASLADLVLKDSSISKVRTAARNKKDLRVVLDLTGGVKPRSFVLPAHGDKNDRLVLDLYDKEKATVKTVKTEVTEAKRDIVIAIDAGHGGEDPGASGPKRLREKNVVLAISKELAALINKEKGYRAELVRKGDYYIPLRKRRDLARKKRADLFISIHADAFKDKRAYGASVFALSRSGATSETARFLAKRENDADLIGGVGGVSLDDKDKVLAGVLVDLSMTATLSSSLQVGAKVLKNLGGVARLHKKHVEQAGFAVLKSPDVPSILVETGFISNPGEAKKLNSKSYRSRLAKSIFTGAKQYFYQYPPADSYVSWKKNGGDKKVVALASKSSAARTVKKSQAKKTSVKKQAVSNYVISRGDTLSAIARRHNISVKDLLSYNGLSDSLIKIGQKLKIPTSS